VRPSIGPVITYTVTLVIGTIVGAAIAAAITLEIGSRYALGGLLFVFAFAMFSSRLVNPVLFQMFLTSFIFILLNLIYPGQWTLAEVRIIDIVIGGAIAIVTVYLVILGTHSDRSRKPGESIGEVSADAGDPTPVESGSA
jgi:uncharacterized membrane protein YccC